MTHFSIKDLAEFTGLKQHTIRIWEQRYALLNPTRASSSHRTYNAAELTVLLDAVLLNQNGYKISRIASMPLEEKLQTVFGITDRQQKTIHELIISMAKMDAVAFERVLNEGGEAWGIHTMVQQVLLPFCDTVGLLENSSVKNYQENILVVRQAIKQRLHAGIDALPQPAGKKKVLLFLAVGAFQELTLLFMQYLLKKNDFATIHLGNHITPEQLRTISTYTRPQYIATHNSKKSCSNDDLWRFVESLDTMLPGTTFISLEHSMTSRRMLGPHYRHAATLPDALEIIFSEGN